MQDDHIVLSAEMTGTYLVSCLLGLKILKDSYFYDMMSDFFVARNTRFIKYVTAPIVGKGA